VKFLKSWRTLLGIAISAGFLFFAFRGQDYGRIREAVRSFDYRYLIPALALYLLGIWTRAFRWSVLLRPLTKATTRDVAPITVVGFMANNVLPLRTGEVVRAYVLSKRYDVTKTSALATIAVERLFDGLTMLGFMLVAATAVSFTSELRHLALLAFVLFAVALIGLFLLTLGGNIRDRLLQVFLGPLPTPVADRVERMAESFLSGLGVLKRKGDLAAVAGASVLAWLLEASTYYMISRGFNADLKDVLGVGEILLTTGVANLATLVPSSPGYVGPFEYGVQLVVSGALGVPRELAISFAIVVHATLYFPITIWGAFEWWRQHLSLRQVREIEGEPVEKGTPAAVVGATVGSTSLNGAAHAASNGVTHDTAVVSRATTEPAHPSKASDVTSNVA
jgi:glycosyltransferase 2 family protein